MHPAGSRIESYQNGRRVAFAYRPPLLSCSPFQSEDTVLERYATPHGAEYRERQTPTCILFLHDGEPTEATAHMGEQRFRGWLRPGDMWLIPSLTVHSSFFPKAHGGVVLSIGSLALERHAGPLMHGGRIELTPRFNLKDGLLEHLMRGLTGVAQDGTAADSLLGELLLNAVCVRLAKRYAISKLNPAHRRGGLPPMRLKRVLAYIEANIDRSISLSSLAHVADMSLYHFAGLFKRSTSLSPHQYVLQRRIQRAKQLLRETNNSILELSLSLGFEHPNNFARAFRRVTGVSPTNYRDNPF
jgi:AraC family transcriptional regulator